MVPSTGAALPTVICALDATTVWNGSLADSVAVMTASSLQLIVGESVFVAPGVQTVPGFDAVVSNDHDVTIGSPSGSVAVPCSVTVPPSTPVYGPPALTTGAPSCFVMMRTSSKFWPSLETMVTVRPVHTSESFGLAPKSRPFDK